MLGVTLTNGELRVRDDLRPPEIDAGEALIRVTCAGICATDLEIIRGYAGFRGILGHEFVGIVEACDHDSWIGQRVVGSINLACRQCATCLAGEPEHCPQRTVLGILGKDGVFADYTSLPVANLHRVPDSVDDEQAVFTEPLAAALRVRQQLRLSPTMRIAVVGPGRLGILIGQVLALDGALVTMLGRRSNSLALPERLGLGIGLVADAADGAFDLVVEATGNEEGFAHALRLIKPRGILVLKSTFAGMATLDLTRLVVAEINVVGSRCGPFSPSLRLLEAQSIEVLSLIDARYPLVQAEQALDHAARPGVRKVLLYP